MNHSLNLTYVGHATVLIEMDGLRVLTDPILRERAGFLRRRNVSIDPNTYRNINAVLISHIHMDHLDLPSLQLMEHRTRLIVPHGAASILTKQGFQNVEEMRVGDTKRIGVINIRSTYAEHVRARYPFGPTADCMGYVISGGYDVYFAGDTDLFPGMTDIAFDLDVALLPVWGWGPTIRGLHMSPLRAAQALTLLHPRLAIPIHWGTMAPLGMARMNPSFLTRPPHQFARYAAQLATRVGVRVLPPGSSLTIDGVYSDES